MRQALPLLIVPLLLAGCATTPAPLQGQFTAVSASEVAVRDRAGDRVRWGGVVIEVEPAADHTCIQVLSRELSRRGRPLERDTSAGRFLACRSGFYDPEVFTPGREITVTGTVDSLTRRMVGEYDYPMPRVAAEVIYLWPPRPRYDDLGYGMWSPWYGPWAQPRWSIGLGFRHHHRGPVRPLRPPARTGD